MRLIEEFLAALQRMLEKKEFTSRRETLEKLYDQFVGPHDFYHMATLEDVFKALAGEDNEHRAMKIQMLAELYYYDAQMETEPLRQCSCRKPMRCTTGCRIMSIPTRRNALDGWTRFGRP